MRVDFKLWAMAGLFFAVLSAPATAATIAVPVLNTTLSPGDIIGEHDITWTEKPAKQVTQTIITRRDDIIGMSVRRPLRAGTELRFADVQRPVLIKRGALVTMIVKTPNMVLTAVGRAQENGSKGDYIRLNNVSSNTPVEGLVVSAREVMIVSSNRVASLGH